MDNQTAVLDQVMEVASPSAEQTAPRSVLSGLTPDAGAQLPDWFRDLQRSAWTEFAAQPTPGRKDQAWRFSNVKHLDLASYKHPEPLSEETRSDLIERSGALENSSARLVFGNDQLLHRDSLPEALQKRGVIFQPLERALVEHEDLFRKHFMAEPAMLGSSKFAALHQALVSSGTFLYIPRGVEIEAPIEVFHWLHGAETAIFPHLLLVAEEMSKVTVLEHFRSADPGQRGFACGVNDLIVGAGAKVTYACAQNWGEEVVALQMNATTVGRDASSLSLNLHLGAAYSRFESLCRLVGEGARSDLLAVSVAGGEQEFDARTLQDHVSPHAMSDLLYKNALYGQSRNTFGGLIRVEPNAHFTDAYQKVRNLLLSDDAEANSMPGLEILADNVKCSHGATSGQIDDEEIFYLLTRGIPSAAAKQLVVAGFLNEVINRLQQPAVAEHLEKLIAEKFALINRAG